VYTRTYTAIPPSRSGSRPGSSPPRPLSASWAHPKRRPAPGSLSVRVSGDEALNAQAGVLRRGRTPWRSRSTPWATPAVTVAGSHGCRPMRPSESPRSARGAWRVGRIAPSPLG
jgi:hypothetical protein